MRARQCFALGSAIFAHRRAGKDLRVAISGGRVLSASRAESRVAGLALLVGIAGSMTAALVGGLNPGNPDIRGYLGPAIALIATLSGTALVLGSRFSASGNCAPSSRWLSWVAPSRAFRCRQLTQACATPMPPISEVRELLTALPVRSALFTHHFETGFLVGYQRFVEGARPDVAWVHLAFAGEPGYAARVRAAEPELRSVVDAYRERAGLPETFAMLDTTRPVASSPTLRSPWQSAESSVPPAISGRQRAVPRPNPCKPCPHGWWPRPPRITGARLPGLAQLHRCHMVVRVGLQ